MKNQIKCLILFLFIINISFMAHTREINGNSNPRLSNDKDSWDIIWDYNNYDSAFDIALDSEENILVCGKSGYHTIVYDLLLVKFNSSGNYLWNRTWGDYGGKEIGKSIGLDSSDNIFIAAHVEGEYLYIVKFDKFGTYQWNVSSGISEVEEINQLLLDQFGNIYVVGVNGLSSNNIFVVKFNNAGIKIWEYFRDISFTIQYLDFSLDSLNNILVVGNYNNEVYLFKLDISGNFLWDIKLDGELDTEFSVYRLTCMTLDSADNIYLAGRGDNYFLMVKINSTYQFQWLRKEGKYRPYGTSCAIALDSSDNIYLVGDSPEEGETTPCDIVLIKYDSTGEFQAQGKWPMYMRNRQEHATGIAIDSSDNIYLVGSISSADIFLMKNYEFFKPPSANTEIAGFDIIIAFGISSMVSILLVYKLKKQKNL